MPRPSDRYSAASFERSTYPITALSGGISRQPPATRLPNQVEDAYNAVFSVVDGCGHRPGAWLDRFIAIGSLSGTAYRLHGIDRDGSERYAVVYGAGILRVFEVGGLNLECTVTISGAATTYLGSATDDQLRLRSIVDYTLIANTLVATALTTSDSFAVERTRKNYDTMVSFSTTVGHYLRTEQDSTAQTAGYWQYEPGTYTYALENFVTLTNPWSVVTGYWDDANANPMGFRIAFRRVALTGFTNGSYNHTTRVLTHASFSGYTWRPGDMLYITGGTGWAANKWYAIESATGSTVTISATQPTAAWTLPGADNVNTAANDSGNIARVGLEIEPNLDFQTIAVTDMNDVALAWQSAMRVAGAFNACCAWVPQTSGGAFQITSPFRGTNADIYAATSPIVYTIGVNGDISTGNAPFDGTANYQTFAGGGGVAADAMDSDIPEARYTRVAAPNQIGAKLDPTTMPAKMVRTNTSRSGAITGWTAASPTVVTCVGHGMVVGQVPTIAGATGGSPGTANGAHAVTAVTANTFTIAVDLSGGAATGGTFQAPALFNVDTIAWTLRTSGDATTNPAPKPLVNGYKVSDIGFFHRRLALALGEYVIYSQTDDLFNYFQDDFRQVVDSDPISLPLSSDEVTITAFLTTVSNVQLVTTQAGRQFTIDSDLQPFTPTGARAIARDGLRTLQIRPAAMSERLYLLGYLTDTSGSELPTLQFLEMDLTESAPTQSPADLTKHVEGILPQSMRSIAVHANSSVAVVLPKDGYSMFVHQAFWSGNQKVQSAWTRFEYDSTYFICDAIVLAGSVYMLCRIDGRYSLERQPLGRGFATPGYPWPVHLDRKMRLTGSYNGGTGKTTFTLPTGVQASGSTVNRLVTKTGVIATADAAPAPPSVLQTFTGDFSAAECTLGCAITAEVELTCPYWRDDQGRPLGDADPSVARMTVIHRDAGAYKIRMTQPSAPDKSKDFSTSAAAVVGLTNAAFDYRDRTITKTAAFASYKFRLGDMARIPTGTGFGTLPGWYEVERRLSADVIVLKWQPGLPTAVNADTAIDFLGQSLSRRGRTSINLNGRADDVQLFIESTSPMPFIIAGYSVDLDYAEGMDP